MERVYEIEPMTLKLFLARGDGGVRKVAECPPNANYAEFTGFGKQVAAPPPFEPSQDILCEEIK